MSTNDNVAEAVGSQQELGLKEYEAECFVGLTRLPTATAKQLSEITDVPRTRIYDAIRVLEAQGLVEIQHSSPKEFRAVPLEEAVETLHDRYERRLEKLHASLEDVEAVEVDDQEPVQVIWALSGKAAIANRANRLVENAESEVVLVIGDKSLLTENLLGTLNSRSSDDVDIVVGAVTEDAQNAVSDAVPGATTFVSGLGWLRSDSDDEVAIGRLLLVDRSAFLVSSITPRTGEEQAVFGGGFGNGLVVIARRLLAQGLFEDRDPGQVRTESE